MVHKTWVSVIVSFTCQLEGPGVAGDWSSHACEGLSAYRALLQGVTWVNYVGRPILDEGRTIPWMGSGTV